MLSSRDLADDEDHNENSKKTDNHDKDYVYHECDSFLDKLLLSLRLLRIDRADRVFLNELATIPTVVRKKRLLNLEKLELQSHDQRLLKAVENAVQYSGVVVKLVGCQNHCWNCDAATPQWTCKYGCGKGMEESLLDIKEFERESNLWENPIPNYLILTG